MIILFIYNKLNYIRIKFILITIIQSMEQNELQNNESNKVWSALDRNEFINEAINSKLDYGYKNQYKYKTFPKTLGIDIQDLRRSSLTDCLAKTIFNGSNPIYRKISIEFYNTLIKKLSTSIYTSVFMGHDIIVLQKGSNAYAYLTGENDEYFKFSDSDIMIYINPYLPIHIFNEIKTNVKIIVMQTLSQYKRLLDCMFFMNRPIDNPLFNQETINAFKKEYKDNLMSISIDDIPENAEILSPFESDEIRNFCSRNSCIIINSRSQENTIVMVDVPHYDKSERIPLRKSPLFCSVNETIDFSRDKDNILIGHFDLFRMRFNNMYIETDNDKITCQERVTSDFIDVSIPAQNDAELLDFWQRGKCLYIYEKYVGMWIMIPDMQSCINDLYKMLTIYDCPESKKNKRIQKYNKLLEIQTLQANEIIKQIENYSLY